MRCALAAGWPSAGLVDGLDGEAQLAEHPDRTGLPALEVRRGEALACSELVCGAEQGLRWVAAVVVDQLVRGRGRKPMPGEERLRAKPVVFLYCAPHVIASELVPVRGTRHRSSSRVVR